MENKYLLACESSCDETAFSVYDLINNKVISSIVHSQILDHKAYNGVVPEIASKEHINHIDSVFRKSLEEANLNLNDIDVFAVTNGPGLPGSLLIGLNYVKALAWTRKKKFIPINHLSGHVYSSTIEKTVLYPHICLSASGGHTSLYYVESEIKYRLLGTTLDDSAGECFDKISNLLGHGYPGGAIIEKLAEENNFENNRRYPANKLNDYKFSFSGLKTAVLYDLVNNNYYDLPNKKLINSMPHNFIISVASSLLNAISTIFCKQIKKSIMEFKEIKGISFVGGVACNKYIQNNIKNLCNKHNLEFYYPSPKYCTDNAAMIAIAAANILKNSDEKYFYNYDIGIFSS